jgi:hypothetical protein
MFAISETTKAIRFIENTDVAGCCDNGFETWGLAEETTVTSNCQDDDPGERQRGVANVMHRVSFNQHAIAGLPSVD